MIAALGRSLNILQPVLTTFKGQNVRLGGPESGRGFLPSPSWPGSSHQLGRGPSGLWPYIMLISGAAP